MSSWPDRPAVLVAALSGRAIAAAAWRAGYAPLVADLFGDLDTRDLAADLTVLPGGLTRRTPRAALLAALDRMAEARHPVGVVYGSGFEDRPALLEAMGRRHGLLGNDAAAVARLKDPLRFAALCRECGVPHPDVRAGADAAGAEGSESAAAEGGAWLEKRRGGSGGMHVRPRRGGRLRRGRYLQRRAAGEAVSALLLADGRRGLVLGCSAQWTAPTPRQPFRYGGAVRPAGIGPDLAARIGAALGRVTAASGLVGLNSADLLVDGDEFTLLEINPRPGASLDVFPDADGTLFRLHVAACRGRMPDGPPVFPGAGAAAVAYATRPVVLPDGFHWPDWTADRQPPARPVDAGAPLCTVLAAAVTAKAARDLVLARIADILARAATATADGMNPGGAK